MPTTQNKKESQPLSPFSWINISSVILGLLIMFSVNHYITSQTHIKSISYSEFLHNVDNGAVKNLVLSDEKIFGQMDFEGQKDVSFVTVPARDDTLIQKLYGKNIPFTIELKDPLWSFIFSWILPILFFYLVWSFIGRRLGGGSAGILSMTKSKAKKYLETEVKTTFTDVAGVDEAKDELLETVNYLQDPKRYTRLGGRAPKGVLLIGPPGTGKTLLARAVAGEAKVPFFSINGSEFVEMLVGLGAARVRDLFQQARQQAPCILFIDEIDALGKSRSAGFMGTGANDEKEQTLNQLLAEMDGFDTSEGVIMLAATNRPEILDPALLRAGRFDRQIVLSNPDLQGRVQILKVHVKKIKLDQKVDLNRVAALTPGFSGADIANLVNEAALIATRQNENTITEQHFTQAIERIVAGPEKKSKIMNAKEKKRVTYHELGHATVALGLNVTDKIQKISTIPRGMSALGYTLQRPLEDRYLLDEEEMFNKIAILLGGRAAETIYFNQVSTGAADDLAKASDIARAMVTQYGMSKTLGLESFDVRRAPLLQSPYDYSTKQFSETTAREIDLEIKSILTTSFKMANEVLQKNKLFIEEAAKKLLETETLDEDQITSLWGKYHSSSKLQELQ